MRKWLLVFSIALFFPSAAAFAAEYSVDKSHTNIGFSVRHMVISNVKGNFGDFSGDFTFDEKTKNITKISAVIKAASINTNEQKRDDHLRSPDFLDVKTYPDITFVHKSTKSSGSKMTVLGDLTIHGVTKEVTLEGEFIGAAKDPWGNNRAGFTASGVLHRGDFGLKWNKLLDNGGVVVGEEVKLLLEVEGIEKKPTAN